uniref:Putative ovule protein n=1 Tax=Solanum chacoense TaxID=4108 RepID=A0A0V0I548_SOLCH
MPRRRNTADIKDPFQRRSFWLKTFDPSKKASRAYDTTARRYHSHRAVTKFPQDNLRDHPCTVKEHVKPSSNIECMTFHKSLFF